MTNREKYITRRDEYDLMITIYRSTHKLCPIETVGAPKPKCLPSIYGLAQVDCPTCIQRWLNEEVTTLDPQRLPKTDPSKRPPPAA